MGAISLMTRHRGQIHFLQHQVEGRFPRGNVDRGISQLLPRAIMHECMDAIKHARTHAPMQTCGDARSAVSLRVDSILSENVLRRGQQQ